MPSQPETVETLLIQAHLEARRGQKSCAASTLSRVLAIDPHCGEAASMLDDLTLDGACAPPVADANVVEPPGMIDRMGTNWLILGWALFAGWFLGIYLAGPIVALIAFALWVGWWIMDVIDQQPAAWQIAVGLAMLAISFLPLGGALRIAAWVIYWMHVRE